VDSIGLHENNKDKCLTRDSDASPPAGVGPCQFLYPKGRSIG